MPSPETPQPPDWESIKLIVWNSGAPALSMLAVATYCNGNGATRKDFLKALKHTNMNKPKNVLKDLDQLEPFFVAALSDLKTFRTKLERESNLG